jgi:hypothetical protein
MPLAAAEPMAWIQSTDARSLPSGELATQVALARVEWGKAPQAHNCHAGHPCCGADCSAEHVDEGEDYQYY